MDIRAWREDLDRWGLRRFLWRRVMIGLRRRLVLCRVNVRAIDPSKEPLRQAGGCEIRFATRDELLHAAEDPSSGLNPRDIETALARGDICVGAYDGNRMIAYVWRSFSTARWAPNMWVVFEKPYRYGHKGYTDPAYRGRRIANAVSLFMDRECVERGYTHTISMIETHNYMSIEAIKYRPAVVVGYAGYVTWRGRHYPFRTPGARRHLFHLRFVEDERSMMGVTAAPVAHAAKPVADALNA